MNKGFKHIASILVLIFFIFSCKDKGHEYHSLMDKIEAKSNHYDGSNIKLDTLENDEAMIEITERHQRFWIPERKGQLKSYACTECHTEPLDQLKNKENSKNAHWDIKLKHANENTMNCLTCHKLGDLNNLRSLTEDTIDINFSYKLCSQCHSNQFKDWVGGAHGKNIGGWTNPRTAMTCVNCHNPHQPHIQSKWPARFNTKKELQRK